MRRNSLLAILAILISGCASTQPERVYVDADRVLASDKAPELKGTPLPQPPPAKPPVSVKQAGLPATSTTDRTLERLAFAKRLIEENRNKSIASLSAMLTRIYEAQAEDEIERRRVALLPERDLIFNAALQRLREVFEQYGQRRGPLLAALNNLARSPDLKDQQIPTTADGIQKLRITRSNATRAQIRELDREYDAQARQLLAEAQQQIQAEIAKLQEQAKQLRGAAETKAVQEAESKATQTQTALNVRIKQLVPEHLPSVPARQVVIPGAAMLPPAPTDTARAIFGSLEERRHLIDQEIDIWIKTTGRERSRAPKGVRDATEEFLQWRRAHEVGP